MDKEKLKVRFISNSDEGLVETITDDDLYTTDMKKCRENGERLSWIFFLNSVEWETFTHDELQKVFDVVGDIIVAKEKEQ